MNIYFWIYLNNIYILILWTLNYVDCIPSLYWFFLYCSQSSQLIWKNLISPISKQKHDETSNNLNIFDFLGWFSITLRLMKSNGCVPLPKNILHKNLWWSHILSQWVDINSIYAKIPLEMFFRTSSRVSFLIFSQGCTRSWGVPPMHVRNFVYHVRIFNSSPMQHLRWSSLWQKKVMTGNRCWTMLYRTLSYM